MEEAVPVRIPEEAGDFLGFRKVGRLVYWWGRWLSESLRTHVVSAEKHNAIGVLCLNGNQRPRGLCGLIDIGIDVGMGMWSLVGVFVLPDEMSDGKVQVVGVPLNKVVIQQRAVEL